MGSFDAMASPCEIQMAVADRALADRLLQLAAAEAWRIERKFSRYRDDGIVSSINDSNGQAVTVDAETCHLLDFAFRCFELSDGLFDITSGILRKAWSFGGNGGLPAAGEVAALLPYVGLDKAYWRPPEITLPAGMQIDLGGIGKEYAVDRTLALLAAHTRAPVLVNYGGDMACSGPQAPARPWRIGIESPDHPDQAQILLELSTGALATSGNTRRFLLSNGKRFGHVLNPRTGWPVENAPRSVTVAATSCSKAGMLATLAMLQGRDAEAFLQSQAVPHWVLR